MGRRDELPERPRLADDRRQLRPRRHQHPHVVGVEDARLDGLHDEHPCSSPRSMIGTPRNEW